MVTSHRFLLAAGLLICASLALAVPPHGSAQPPAKPPELKVLERFIGKWKFEMIAKRAESTPKETRYSGVSTNEWVLDGWFQHHKVKHDAGAEGIDILTYDQRKKAYRSWSFDSFGFSTELSGDWDEKTQTLTTKGDLGDDATVVSAMKFLDKDNREIHYVAKDKTGKVFLDIRGKLTRQP